MNPVAMGFLASLVAGTMTAVGALPVLVGHEISRRMNDVLLGFAAGIMLTASFTSLIAPGIAAATRLHGDVRIAALIAVIGIVLGVGFVALLNEWVPHEHFFQGLQGPSDSTLNRIWLLVLAITIHNIPEGLAVGVGFANGDVARGTTLAIGIGLQNAPEGLAVAVALLASGYTRAHSFAVAGLTGMVEPVAGLIGALAASLSELALPWALTFAAGAMIYVISHEIIPETHRHGYENEATLGLTVGLVAMLYLDVAYGAG
jgi:ZIP family zinc transporter